MTLVALPAAALALIAIDYRQTIAIFRRGYGEKNPLIRLADARWGEAGIAVYYALAAAILTALWLLPLSRDLSALRTGGTAVFCVVQAFTCLSNRRLLR